MSINYNNTKSMKGAAVGTIIPWSGAITEIPAGWLLCNGQFLENDAYPYLFEVIGTTYGSGVGVFRLPQIGGKTLADMRASYLPAGTPSAFTNLIGDNQSNNNSNNYVSNVDLRVDIDNNAVTGGYTGVLSDVTATNPAFFSSFKTTERKLGDMHMATHTHTGEYNSVAKLNSPRIEACQGFGSNAPFSGCGTFGNEDCCETLSHYLVELNWTANQVNALYRNSILGGFPIGGSGNVPSINSGGTPTLNSPPRVNSVPKNWLGNSDDTILKTDPYNWPTTLSGDYTTWTAPGTNQLTGHSHGDINYSINVGNFSVSQPVSVSDISPGNVAPINTTGNTDILKMEVDSATPSVSTTYIIKSF
jgi:microcystin-dependent protein